MNGKTREQIENAFTLALEGIGFDFVNELKTTAPVDSGRLRNSIKHNVEGKTVNINMADYGYIVEFGSKPHKIRPKNKKSLHWKSGSKDVFAMEVNHPGTEPQPFIRQAINTKLRNIIYDNLKRQLE